MTLLKVDHFKRNKGRSLSQSLADTAALAMGHTLDNISDWFDTPTKEPLGASDKKKLTRATTMSTQKAAKLHQEVLLYFYQNPFLTKIVLGIKISRVSFYRVAQT